MGVPVNRSPFEPGKGVAGSHGTQRNRTWHGRTPLAGGSRHGEGTRDRPGGSSACRNLDLCGTGRGPGPRHLGGGLRIDDAGSDHPGLAGLAGQRGGQRTGSGRAEWDAAHAIGTAVRGRPAANHAPCVRCALCAPPGRDSFGTPFRGSDPRRVPRSGRSESGYRCPCHPAGVSASWRGDFTQGPGRRSQGKGIGWAGRPRSLPHAHESDH